MIVIDASVFVELLTNDRGRADVVKDALGGWEDWAVPEHAMLEVASAFRGLWRGGHLTDAEFASRLDAIARIEALAFSTAPLLPRIGELRANATVYDAAYIALAESLDVPLLTLDRKLARIPGSRADVRVLGEG